MKAAIFAALLSVIIAIAAPAAEKAEVIPRFVSLRSDVVNLRSGPGDRYPIEWVYRRKGLPVEIIAQHDQWRQVRDWQGTEGWVHQRLVTAARNVIVKGTQRTLHIDAVAASPPVAKLDPGVIAHLLECHSDWCRVEVQNGSSDVRGWIGRDEIWGVLPDEVVK